MPISLLMINNQKYLKSFIFIETILYCCFVILDLLANDSSLIKYLSIILCLLFAIINKKKYQSLALFFTLIADYFLLIKINIIPGLISFIIVQLIYMLYFHTNNIPVYLKYRIITYLLLTVINLIIKLPLTYYLALLYFSALLFNLLSCVNYNKIHSLGMFLFILCDICVGLHNVLNYGLLYKIISLLMWIFYLPSQVLLSIGAK